MLYRQSFLYSRLIKRFTDATYCNYWNGIAGTTASRIIRKNSDAKITLISSESPHFFSRTALMYVFMGHMTFKDIIPYKTSFWKKNRIDLLLDKVTKLNHAEKTIETENSGAISYDKIVLGFADVVDLQKQLVTHFDSYPLNQFFHGKLNVGCYIL